MTSKLYQIVRLTCNENTECAEVKDDNFGVGYDIDDAHKALDKLAFENFNYLLNVDSEDIENLLNPYKSNDEWAAKQLASTLERKLTSNDEMLEMLIRSDETLTLKQARKMLNCERKPAMCDDDGYLYVVGVKSYFNIDNNTQYAIQEVAPEDLVLRITDADSLANYLNSLMGDDGDIGAYHAIIEKINCIELDDDIDWLVDDKGYCLCLECDGVFRTHDFFEHHDDYATDDRLTDEQKAFLRNVEAQRNK